MKAIVHIGTPKTGSTSAQSWLSSNRDRLREMDIFYPKSLGSKHHIKLSTACRRSDRPERGFKLFQIRSAEDHKEFTETLFAAFEKELFQNKTATTCILSSEWLYDRLTEPEEKSALKGFLERHFDDYEIVAWVRPQVEYILSFSSTIARNGGRFDKDVLENLRQSDALDFNQTFKEWETAFGKDKIRVIPFKRHPNASGFLVDAAGGTYKKQGSKIRENTRLGLNLINLSNNIKIGHANGRTDAGWDRRRYFQNISSNENIQINKTYAKQIHVQFSAGNADLISRHDTLSAGDLDPNWSKFPEKGNLKQLEAKCSFSNELTQLIELMSSDLKIQTALTEIARAEVEILRGRTGKDNEEYATRLLDAAEDSMTVDDYLTKARKSLQKLAILRKKSQAANL